jgi:hypothetical protein
VSFYDPDRIGDYPLDPSEATESPQTPSERHSGSGSVTSDLRTRSDIERGDTTVRLKSLKDLGPMAAHEEEDEQED